MRKAENHRRDRQEKKDWIGGKTRRRVESHWRDRQEKK